jgi:pyruvate phosphate dikinase-like enzyme
MATRLSTGIAGLDAVINHLREGDNVVWQVDSVADLQPFITSYVEQAKQDGRKIVYMRFADHAPLVPPDPRVTMYELNAYAGFETFSTQVHRIISESGRGAYYVFDCLSDLLSAWASDLMIGNFFRITCPYLFELDTIVYFALLRNHHSYKTIARIRETTQLLLDLYGLEDSLCIHPLKVFKRYTPTMFLPHLKQGDRFVPITSSVDATKLMSHISDSGRESMHRKLDHWDRLFLRADELSEIDSASVVDKEQTVERLCSIMIGREERILSLAKRHFTLDDLLEIKNRMIGTGFIGGKAVGMLLANKIVSKDPVFAKSGQLERHDSFYVGSDIFYTYIVENGWWKRRMEQKTKEGYFEVAAELREKMLANRFPDQIRDEFQEMLDYFGQSPIIVRSSSLLEDAFGNAFAGKYESFFCVNQGDPEQRAARLEEVVRQVYSSTMNEDALTYRLQRGLDQHDEQMALLIQRVSGSYRKTYFFPDLAGVGVSHNTFAWNPQLDPKAGMLRLVVGLGTRAVNRVEDDYPRVLALDAPLMRPVGGMDDVRRFSQNHVDLLDINDNALKAVPLRQIFDEGLEMRVDLMGAPDHEMTQRAKELGGDRQYWLLTFEKLLSETPFVQNMQTILKSLEKSYEYPVDIEFTVNFAEDGTAVFNLLQCRPLQTKGRQPQVEIPSQIDPAQTLFRCEGYFMGGSISVDLKRIIYVRPESYESLPMTQKYDIARLVGNLNRQISDRLEVPTLLLGPGRWGTTTPSLGVPVSFSEINNITVLGELAYEGGNLMPELSFGTHFFQDLVESDIFYVAVFPQQDGFLFDKAALEAMPNRLGALVPERAKYEDVVRVLDITEGRLRMMADVISQQALCFFE